MKPHPDWFSLALVTGSARRALQWRLLLLWVLWMLVPAALLTVPMWSMLRANLDYSVHAAALAQQLDLVALTDLMAAHGKHAMAFNVAGVSALITTLLISPLLSGMAITAARAAQPSGFRDLTRGGLSEYPRMLRMLVWSVVPLGLAAALGNIALNAVADYDAAALDVTDAAIWSTLATLLMVLLLVLAHASVDAGRAALGVERRRSSAFKAWWRGCRMLAARPLATLAPYLLISAAGLGLGAMLMLGRLQIGGATWPRFIAAFLLVQVIVALLGWMRSARLFALLEVARRA